MVERNHLARLRELAGQAQASGDRATVTAALAEMQRITALALGEAVARAREQGISWRELAAELRMAATTLHGQYRSGRGMIVVGSPVPSAAMAVPSTPAAAGRAWRPPAGLHGSTRSPGSSRTG